MKVNESEPKCDFCEQNEPTQTLNDGLWWICDLCYADIYDIRGEEE